MGATKTDRDSERMACQGPASPKGYAVAIYDQTGFEQILVGRLGSTPGPPDFRFTRKPINHNKLQHRISLNNKKRVDFRATWIASVCCVLLANIAVC